MVPIDGSEQREQGRHARDYLRASLDRSGRARSLGEPEEEWEETLEKRRTEPRYRRVENQIAKTIRHGDRGRDLTKVDHL